jgi:hypothetical protein
MLGTMNSRRLRAVLVTAFVTLALAGCATGSDYGDLDRDALPADRWPSDLVGRSSNTADIRTSRLVGEDSASKLYLARAIEPAGGVCLLVYTSGTEWVVGCGPTGLEVTAGSSRYGVFDDQAAKGDQGAISKNVFVLPG